jgi:ubiquinone/menaquinone biosynthesis C-methylase UbiE
MPKGSIPCRPNWNITPDIVATFTNLPFADHSFDLVVWDPPHIIRKNVAKSNSIMRMKYAELKTADWKETLTKGFNECYRVLKSPGTLHFKWSECDAPLKEVLLLFPIRPLFKNKEYTSWSVFVK